MVRCLRACAEQFPDHSALSEFATDQSEGGGTILNRTGDFDDLGTGSDSANHQRDQRLELSLRDSQAFLEALLNPPPPNDRVRETVARYRRTMGNATITKTPSLP
ncbi:type II toxin -antitoxin system TacA 1-like antitoxin [Niveispirillum cyanobacteriorum]|uniref:Uncharacterized protein n=1 Tax=Niveispirillum cyanobacteriorum TaxID=1612173 RepID=A0A2K9NDY7_9PROT|nr:DUF1778 domain-containing protein [Niveispirillum cyanobacteriorum]AUN31353.1 hypothetical protein C0V82_14740 [Niveispirillum cyanobacteriorum]GGE71940.1 hypothetical protein GCM10011317_31510 [Niveispirillum cyanobacteriorum]